MQQIIPRIFAPDAKAAAEFYRSAFGGEIVEFYEAADGGCAHAALAVKEAVTLYFSDGDRCPGTALSLALHDVAETRSLFGVLAAGGEVLKPLVPTDWALLVGSVRDRYGVVWEFNCGEGKDAQYKRI